MSERFDYSSFDNSFTTRPESHIAQQRRRDKLRVSQSVTPTGYNIHDLPYHLIQSELNPDLVQVRGIRNCDLLYDQDQAMISSDMLNFSMNTHVFLGQKDAVLQQEPGGAQSSRAIVPDDDSFGTLSKVAGPQNPCHWKGIGSQQSGDWMVSFVNGAGGNACSQTPLFVGEPLIDNPKEAILSKYTSPGCNGYQDVGQSSLTNSASSKQYGELNFSSPVVYQNALQEVVTSSSKGTQGYEMTSLAQQSNREFGHSAWLDGGNKQMVVPTYGNEVSVARLNNGDSWFHRILEGTSTQGNSELGIENSRNARHHDRVAGETSSRSLSLSLSSHSPLTVAQIGERFVSENLQPRTSICSGSQDSKSDNAGYLCPGSKPSIISTSQGNSLQGIAGSFGCTRRSIGPLGPFTGYATILKNSRFLKPAQQLLDEICSCKLIKACGSSERCSREVGTSSEPFLGDNETGRRGGSSEVSSSFNSSSQAGGLGRLGSGSSQTYISEFQQKKAKLMYMEEEVCRRYKQYHQQMQMVVSSFESVAGLSSATPYTSLALKAVTKHFQSLKNAISDQISYITKGSSEHFLSTVTGTSKGDSTMSNIRCIDQKQAGMDRIRIFERQVPQHPIWKPQRGLPERAVAILRSWLFDHFLHPYPTDTDKHVLANQTGLSRNQVSNWFINARVRVWKPMVEEMHMLETKVSAETDHDSGNTQTPGYDGNVGCSGDQSSNKLMIDAMSEKSPKCSAVQLVPGDVEETSEQWAQEKRCRVERHIPQSVDGNNLMGFVPYHGGIGAISLTLGLRHSSDQQQHEHQLRRHYGGQMVYDFVG